jgi:hypothetical protein
MEFGGRYGVNFKRAAASAALLLGMVVTAVAHHSVQAEFDLGEIKSDVRFPSHIVLKQDGVPTPDLTITKTDCNNPYVIFPVPPNVDGGQSK